MSTQTTDAERSTDVRPTYLLAARDDQGCDHVYRTTDETVHIVHAGRRKQVIDLAACGDYGLSIEGYIAQLAAQRDVERVLRSDLLDAMAVQVREAL